MTANVDTVCEVCGLAWNARARELCPRCELEVVKDDLMRARGALRAVRQLAIQPHAGGLSAAAPCQSAEVALRAIMDAAAAGLRWRP